MPSKYLDVADVATLIHHRGITTLPGAAPNTSRGRAVLCLHDAGGNGNDFAALLSSLVERQSPMSFDLPGHGRSGGLDALGSISEMAEHAKAIIDRFGLERPVVIGEGMGGAVALELSDMSPLGGVVLCGAVAASFDVNDEIESLGAITSGKARRSFDQSGYGPETGRPVYQSAFAEWVKTDPRATLGDRRAQADWSLARYSTECPKLVIVGEHQADDEAGRARALADRVDAYRETLPGAARHGVIEQPVGLGAMIDTFIEGLSS